MSKREEGSEEIEDEGKRIEAARSGHMLPVPGVRNLVHLAIESTVIGRMDKSAEVIHLISLGETHYGNETYDHHHE